MEGESPNFKDQVRADPPAATSSSAERRLGVPEFKDQARSVNYADTTGSSDPIESNNNDTNNKKQAGTDATLPPASAYAEPVLSAPLAYAREITPSELRVDEEGGGGGHDRNSGSPAVQVDSEGGETTIRLKRQRLWLCGLLLLLVMAAVATGGVCGSGHCSASSDRSQLVVPPKTSSNVTVGSVTAVPTPAPLTRSPSPEPSTLSPTFTPTPGPSGLPTLDTRTVSILNYLRTASLSDQEIRYGLPPTVSRTPEESAAEWLVQSDPLLLTTDTAPERFRLLQRFALLTLWFVSLSPWTRDTGWATEEHECDWFGLGCEEKDLGANIGIQRVVTLVGMANNNLSGIIPANLGLLTHIQHVSAWRNYLSGALPASVGAFTDMNWFEIWGNEMSGELPATIGNWTKLTLFSMWGQSLSGTLPSTIGQWTDIEVFFVYNNKLGGSVPQTIGAWTSIRDFRLPQNSFSGNIPESIGNWSGIQVAYFEDNQFTGSIPQSVANWEVIKDARFHTNDLTGEVPSGICQSADLTTLWVDCLTKLNCSCCTFCT